MKKLIVIALIVSIITGFAVYNFASNLKKEHTIHTREVVVAVSDIAKNTLIKPDMITIKSLPAIAVHSLACPDINEVKDRIATQDINEGEQILSSRISGDEISREELSFSLIPGFRAFTIKVDEISGVAGFIRKGDRVDIAAITVNEQHPEKKPYSLIIAENLEVLQTGISSSSGEGGAYSSITLLINVKDVPRINYMISEGKYRLVLRSVVDENIENLTPYIP